MKKTVLLVLATIISGLAIAQDTTKTKSTKDLAFLVGEWNVKRINNPDGDEPKVRYGTLTCEWALDDQFISCRYDIPRPNKPRGLDQVYFNYNSIYDKYESIWLSSTWPIKGLMQGDLSEVDQKITLSSTAEFPIEGGVIEYVKGQLTVLDENSFRRRTHIRTSEQPDWYFHMIEEVTRKVDDE